MRKCCRTAKLVALAIALSLPSMLPTPLAVAGSERTVISKQEMWAIRPSNMYELTENKAPQVCEPLLASLNAQVVTALPFQKFGPENQTQKTIPPPFAVTGPQNRQLPPFLRNRFLASPWRTQRYHWYNPTDRKHTISSLEAAYLDLNDDGTVDGLFRMPTSSAMVDYHLTMFVPSIGDRIRRSEVLDEDTARDIIWNHRVKFQKFDPGSFHNLYFTEVVSIGEKPFILIGSGYYGTFKFVDKENTVIIPRVLLLKGEKKDFQRICMFDGVVELGP